MTTPVAGVALDSEIVKLLRAGDVLRVINADSFLSTRGFGNGAAVTFSALDDGFVQIDELPHGSTLPYRFAFVSRPDVPALTDDAVERAEANQAIWVEIAEERAAHITDLEAQASAYKERVEALDWLAENTNVELSYRHDEDDGDWIVHRVNGGINDREWTEVARADTPAKALIAARALLNGADR